MARPPRRQINRKFRLPADGNEVGLSSDSALGAESSEDGACGNDGDETRAQVLAEFETALRAQHSLEEVDVEFLLEQFRVAATSVPLAPALVKPDAESIARTLDALVASNVIAEADRNVLARQFDDALAPLEDVGLKRALEFAERVRRDGELKALEWLTAQNGAGSEQKPLSSEVKAAPTQMRQSITASRSRRLRGPPR